MSSRDAIACKRAGHCVLCTSVTHSSSSKLLNATVFTVFTHSYSCFLIPSIIISGYKYQVATKTSHWTKCYFLQLIRAIFKGGVNGFNSPLKCWEFFHVTNQHCIAHKQLRDVATSCVLRAVNALTCICERCSTLRTPLGSLQRSLRPQAALEEVVGKEGKEGEVNPRRQEKFWLRP